LLIITKKPEFFPQVKLQKMKAKVRIIFLVILIAGAGSGTFITPATGLPVSAEKNHRPDSGPVVAPFPPEGQETILRFNKVLNRVVSKDSGWKYAWQEYNVVGGDTLLWEEVYKWEYAWQEYNVSPEDTIWFDGFLVVGSDTLLWEEVYKWEYAWQEYNVLPRDTIWFDGFLVVGSDTLLREEVYELDESWHSAEGMTSFEHFSRYGRDIGHIDGKSIRDARSRILRINISGLSGEWRDPGLSPVFYNSGRYYDPFYVELLWLNRNSPVDSFENKFFIPYIAPIPDWIEIAVNSRAEREIPLYTYYMPMPVQGPASPAGLVQRRRPRSEASLISVIRSIFSTENEE
jgi:hypothetical protein